MQLRTRLGSASLTDPSWSHDYIRQKNTFIEVVPPLSESVLGFKAWRQHTSEPSSPTVARFSEEHFTDLDDQPNACDSAAVEKPALAAASLCSDKGSAAALPESVANLSWKNFFLDESLAGCDGGSLQISAEKLAGFSAWRRQTPKASGVTEATTEIDSSDSDGRQIWSQSVPPPSSPASYSQEGCSFSKASGVTEATTEIDSSDGDGRQSWSQSTTPPSSPASESPQKRSFSKASGVTDATTDVGSSTDLEDQEASQDRSRLMDRDELAWRIHTGARFARRLPAEDLAAAVAAAPLTEDGRPTSLGSFGHGAGTCRPCAHAALPKGCDSGVLCRFCHFDHPRLHKTRARPCKGKRERFRKLVNSLAAQVHEDPTSFNMDDDKLPPSIKFDSRMKAKLSAKMSQYAEDVRRQQQVVAHGMARPR